MIGDIERIHVGAIGVDSGTMILSDPSYVSGDRSYSETAWDAMGKERFGLIDGGMGAICSTGYGDGVYDVFVEIKDCGEWGKRVSKMEIVFIDEDE